MTCDYCPRDVTVEVTLTDGSLFYCCDQCIPMCIKWEASTTCPVDAIVDLTTDTPEVIS